MTGSLLAGATSISFILTAPVLGSRILAAISRYLIPNDAALLSALN